MATLVLTAVGSIVAGPIGAAIGAIAGQQIDQRIFRPKGREGPRLQDLRVQTSSYGAPIPKLFGTMRVAGTVIWSTDLIETRSRQGGGKGRPRTTVYSYSASFAVLLSGRPIVGVRRIWADGQLLRGVAGDWKQPTGFRLHLGGEDQPPDPFIASAEGATPAYRGCAYAVFENMPLDPYGNRIPSLTFEVDADPQPVMVGTILTELAGGAIDASEGAILRGFAATGGSVRGLIEMLDIVLPLPLRDMGDRLALADATEAPVSLRAEEIGEDGRETLTGAGAVPIEAALTYFEPARDYQLGLQRARRPGPGRAVERIELPAVLDSSEAKALAEAVLARRAASGARRSVRCGWRRLALMPGRTLLLPDSEAVWQIVARTVERDGVRLELEPSRPGSALMPPAEPGRGAPSPDLPHGPTVVELLDLPPLGDDAPGVPRLLVVAAGTQPGWRRASLLVSLNDGGEWDAIGDTAAPAIIGRTASLLPPASEALIDRAGQVEIDLFHAGMSLEDAAPERLLAGANLALLGRELIQFGRAEPLGGTRWRLSELLRGRRDTGGAAGLHAVGERFLLLEREALLAWDPPLSQAGGQVRLLATSVGDPTPAEAVAVAIGEALRPPAPAQFRARRQSDGGYDLSWVRSSRLGWRWLDGADAPLGEEREAYLLTLRRADGTERTEELLLPGFHYAADAVAGDRLAGPNIGIRLIQRGTFAMSRPLELNLDLQEF